MSSSLTGYVQVMLGLVVLVSMFLEVQLVEISPRFYSLSIGGGRDCGFDIWGPGVVGKVGPCLVSDAGFWL